MRKILLIILVIAFLFLLLFANHNYQWLTKNQPPLTDITVQLKWLHQAQFAGMYVAQEKGFYAEEGLNAALIPFSFEDRDPIEKVIDGSVDFGVTGASELVIAQAKGVSAKAIATIYKLSPFSLYSLKESNIEYPIDLVGKRIGIEEGTDGEHLLALMLKNQGIEKESITEIPIGYSADELIAGVTDVSMGYIINEPFGAIEAGHEVNTMLMADYGASIYGDVLIASDEMINDNPDLVLRFLRATLKGWSYAIENPSESLPIVLKYAKDRTWAHEAYMLRESVPLIHTGETPIGWMKDEEWTLVHQVIPNLDQRQMMSEKMNNYTTEFLEEIYNQ